jgi:four helix bundle protein
LIAWERAMDLAVDVYRATEHIPPDERFGLTSQTRRAAVSVPSNIAECYGRQARADYLRHLRIARGSLAELATQVELAQRLRMLAPTSQLGERLAETDRVLQGLIRGLERKV